MNHDRARKQRIVFLVSCVASRKNIARDWLVVWCNAKRKRKRATIRYQLESIARLKRKKVDSYGSKDAPIWTQLVLAHLVYNLMHNIVCIDMYMYYHNNICIPEKSRTLELYSRYFNIESCYMIRMILFDIHIFVIQDPKLNTFVYRLCSEGENIHTHTHTEHTSLVNVRAKTHTHI